jgi:precorrin-3B methylase
MSQRVVEVIKSVDCIAGYTTYIDLIKKLVGEKKSSLQE